MYLLLKHASTIAKITHNVVFVLKFMQLDTFQSGFRTGIPTRIDDRVFALESAKSLPLSQFLLEVYPSLYPVHKLDDQVRLFITI